MSQNNSSNRGNNNPRRRRSSNGTRKNNYSGQGQGQEQRSTAPKQPGKVPATAKTGSTPASAAPGPIRKFLNMVSGIFGKKAAPSVPAKSAYAKAEERGSGRSRERTSPERDPNRTQDSWNRSENRERTEDRSPSSPSRPPRESREQRPPREPREARPAPTMEAPTSERLYVGNLSYDATEQDLAELFKGVGSVRNAEVVINNRTQRSKGYAFVTMSTADEARRAFDVLHNQPFMGRQLVVGGAKASMPQQEQEQEKEDSDSSPDSGDKPDSVA